MKRENEDFDSPELSERFLDKLAINTDSNNNLNHKYQTKELFLDILLLSLAAWSQFGFAFFSQETSIESIEDPKKRYLDPYISPESSELLSKSITRMFQIFSFADSLFTLGTYLNMKNTRNKLIQGFKEGWKEYHQKRISHSAFWLNLGLTLCAFVSGSFASWVGFEQLNLGTELIAFLGFTMFMGLMVSYVMSSAPYIFSPPKTLTDFYKLDSPEKHKILKNIFLTKKSWLGFLPRTLTNAINRSWMFYGLANLTAIHVFKLNSFTPKITYNLISALSCGYQTIMSQGVHDYEETFSKEITEKKKSHSSDHKSRGCLFSFSKILLLFLMAASFIVRAISVPSLYTGEIDDPANNYGVKESIIALLGLILGGYASFQFSRFRYARCEEGIKAIFFESKDNPGSDKRNNNLNNIESINGSSYTVSNR